MLDNRKHFANKIYNRNVGSFKILLTRHVKSRANSKNSRGCNNLIANNKAYIYNGADAFYFQMGWDRAQEAEGIQQELFATLTSDECAVLDLLKSEDMLNIDEISTRTGYSLPKTAGLLLNLEMSNQIRCLPGKQYRATVK